MISLGAAAFWISLAAVLIAGSWFNSRTEAQKHETLRRMIEKTGSVDQARLSELFGVGARPGWANPEHWKMPVSPPGENRKFGYVFGTMIISLGAALTVLFLILGAAGVNTPQDNWIGLACAAALAVLGVGVFVASRFAERPPAKDAKGGDGRAT